MKFPTLHLPFADALKRPWWVKIETQIPACVYYFGPFDSEQEATLSQSGYLDDLIQEESQGITVLIERMRPKKLTICEGSTIFCGIENNESFF